MAPRLGITEPIILTAELHMQIKRQDLAVNFFVNVCGEIHAEQLKVRARLMPVDILHHRPIFIPAPAKPVLATGTIVGVFLCGDLTTEKRNQEWT